MMYIYLNFEGGLGIKRNEDVNKVLMTKLGWRIFTNNDNILAKIMKDNYVKNNDFFIITKKKKRFYNLKRNS